MFIGLRIGHAHHNQDGAARIAGTGNPPFAAVQDIVVSVRADTERDIGGIGRGHLRFGHGKGGTDLAAQQGRQPFGFLIGIAEVRQDFHVAGVRRVAVEHFRSPQHAPHLLGHRRIVPVAQAGTVFGIGQEQIP